MIPRVMPVLLLRGAGLVKTTRFADQVYLGDPVNAVRIFNDKEVDELVLLDIEATRTGKGPNLRVVAEVAGECFMPLAYGGGVQSLDQIEALLKLGVEKIVINSAAATRPALIAEAAARFGSSTIVVSIDVRRRMLRGLRVVSHAGREDTGQAPEAYARRMEELGAGELFLMAVDRDGTMAGYDLDVIRGVTASVSIPVVAAGGAGSVADLRAAVVEGGASAAAAGAMFVFHGPHRGVLINFPSRGELEAAFAGYAADSRGMT